MNICTKNVTTKCMRKPITLFISVILFCASGFLMPSLGIAADTETAYKFNDEANHEPTPHPKWFKKSFYNLKDDIQDAKQQGKNGLMVFIGTEQCSYCKIFINKTLADKKIQTRLRSNYNAIGLELFSDEEITDLDGDIYTVKEFVYKKKAYFSPTLIFYDTNGKEILKIVGYYPPNKFRHVLDFLIDKKYNDMRLVEYLTNVENHASKSTSEMPRDSLFYHTRTDFSRNSSKNNKPLLILLERENCEACNRFHKNILSNTTIRKQLINFERYQLNINDKKTQIITPGGRRITPYEWSKELQIQYTPAFVFFDEHGKLVLKQDSDVQAFRVKRMLKHVKNKTYLSEKQFNRWYADELRRENKTYKVSN